MTPDRPLKIGVLALQGAFAEHIKILTELGAEALPVRLPADLSGLDGLIIPGGESTTILKLMREYKLVEPVRQLAAEGLPIWGTCAGLICLARDTLANAHPVEGLGLMDIAVQRNAFGRQVDSFETRLPVACLGEPPFPAVFIRAPKIESTSSDVEILATLTDGTVVAARQSNLLVTAFHPELTSDVRFHRYYLDMVTAHRAGA